MKINLPYASRVLRLTLLPPSIIDAILGARRPTVTRAALMSPFAVS
jgi:hypothetical protein